MRLSSLSKSQLLEYARLRAMKKTEQMNVKVSPIEKKRYSELANELNTTESELIRQGAYKSLYYFTGIKEERDEV